MTGQMIMIANLVHVNTYDIARLPFSPKETAHNHASMLR